MTDIFDDAGDESIGLEEFHRRIDAIDAPLYGPEHIAACARELARLGRNPDLLWGMFESVEGVEAIDEFFNAPQSFFLGAGKTHYLRLNVWLPENAGTAYREHERDLYSYELAHNHDFRFLTVGYFGPGYETDLYTIPEADVDAQPGQTIRLLEPRRERLRQGRVIHFAPYTDVHVQHYPASLSISINLIFSGQQREHEQLLIDTQRSTVLDYPKLSEQSRMINALQIAGFFASPELDEAIDAVERDAANPRLREAARAAIAHQRRESRA